MEKKSILSKIGGILKIFVPAFLLFAAIGGVAGYKARRSVVQRTLFEQIDVREREGVYIFQYACQANNLEYTYSIDDNKFTTAGDGNSKIGFYGTGLALPNDRLAEYGTLISSILGGTTGGVTLHRVLKKPISGVPRGWTWSAVRKTIIGIVGGITGYAAGYWLGSHYDIDCDSAVFASVLEDSEMWVNIERARLGLSILMLQNLKGAQLSETGRAVNGWEKDPAFECSPGLTKKMNGFEDQISAEGKPADPTSANFHLVNDITNSHKKIKQTPEYKSLVESDWRLKRIFGERIKKGSPLGRLVLRDKKDWDRACAAVAEIQL